MKFLVLPDLQAFNELNEIYNQDFGYPNAIGTARYADPFAHPTDGRVAMPIEPRCEARLTADQLASLVTYDELLSEGFFI